MPESQCNLKREHDESTCSVAAFITQKAKESPPLLAWADPEPTAVDLTSKTGRRVTFQPLVQGVPNWPDDIPLAEVHLFWQNSALHVISKEGGGCRWAMIEEDEIGGLMALRSEKQVLTVRDYLRFGLEARQELKLRAVEYRQHGRLVAWRLITVEQGQANV